MERFEEVQGLGTEALRRLLATGSAHERIWAAWSLGLRLGPTAQPELLLASRREPDAGARRHMLVVLAGFRELDVLAAFARHDPDGYVRASACQFLAAISSPGDPAVRQLLLERLELDSFAEVRLTVIRRMKPSVEREARLLERLVEDPEPEIRAAAVEAFSGTGARFLALLRKRVLVEQDKELRRGWLRRWHELEGDGPLLAFAASQPLEQAQAVFELFQGREGELAWEDLARLASLEDPQIEARVLGWLKVQGAPSAAREWLLSLALRDTRQRMPSELLALLSWRSAWTARHLLLEALEGLSAEDIGAGEWQLFSGLRELLEATHSPDDEDDQEEFYDEKTGEWVYGPSAETRLFQRLQQLLEARPR